ncbi:hypothetical protein CERSUDRAFT_115893 [Gelatoporia subvermispora B]|uniref:NACHT domain-containing protein n=1 Tax=Ceriporiopsis subvermispora (strain B) TaxID=914234 RepID=M2QV61_CERS8|nr:hypothetical protein CERSUDRAFT_115893 [Gelatoporia subvermispora B]
MSLKSRLHLGRKRTSPVEGPVQSDNATNSEAHSDRFGDELDTVIANILELLDVTDDLLSGVSVPGLKEALTIVKSLLDRVQKTRENLEEKDDVCESIQALLKLLRSSIEAICSAEQSTSETEDQDTMKNTLNSQLLQSQIGDFVQALNKVLKLSRKLDHSNFLSAAWHAKTDASVLERMHKKIDEARDQFIVRGELNKARLLSEQLNEAQKTRQDAERHHIENRLRELQRLEEEKREKENKILSGLTPAPASHRSDNTSEKARLEPGTRIIILNDLVTWATQTDIEHRVFVLHGGAGMGKSSIAHQLTRQLAEDYIVASFFFNRGNSDCNDAHRLFPTLAHQLASCNENLRAYIVEAVETYLSKGSSQVLSYQAHDLLESPLKQFLPSPSLIFFAIDGIDECTNSPTYTVPDVLRLLCDLAHQIPTIRILIATRPEGYIMDSLRFDDEDERGCTVQFCDLQQQPNVDADIRFFIDAELKRCAAGRKLPLLLARPDAADTLTRLSDGLFVYASTVTRALTQDRYYAVELFDKLLVSHESLGGTGIYARLDALYNHILDNAFSEIRTDATRVVHTQHVLAWLALVQQNFTVANLQAVGIPEHATSYVIDRLRSVLEVEDEITPTTVLKASHASFPQYLVDATRCHNSTFAVVPSFGHALIACSLLNLLSRDEPVSWAGNKAEQLVRGAATYVQWPPTSDYLSSNEQSNHSENFEEHEGIWPEQPSFDLWAYANRSWIDHITPARLSEPLNEALALFCKTRLRDWIVCVRPWGHPYAEYSAVDVIERVRDWYERQEGRDENILTFINNIVIARRQELANEKKRRFRRYLQSLWNPAPRTSTSKRPYTFRIPHWKKHPRGEAKLKPLPTILEE